MATTQCPKCNGEAVYVSDFRPLLVGDNLVTIFNPEGNNIRLEISLCANCGFVEISAAKDQLEKLPRLVKTKYWRKKA